MKEKYIKLLKKDLNNEMELETDKKNSLHIQQYIQRDPLPSQSLTSLNKGNNLRRLENQNGSFTHQYRHMDILLESESRGHKTQ